MTAITKDTSAALASAIFRFNGFCGQEVTSWSRDRATDSNARAGKTVIGSAGLNGKDIRSFADEITSGLNVRMENSTSVETYGADRNTSATTTVSIVTCQPWKNTYGVVYAAIDEEGAQALMAKIAEVIGKTVTAYQGGMSAPVEYRVNPEFDGLVRKTMAAARLLSGVAVDSIISVWSVVNGVYAEIKVDARAVYMPTTQRSAPAYKPEFQQVSDIAHERRRIEDALRKRTGVLVFDLMKLI